MPPRNTRTYIFILIAVILITLYHRSSSKSTTPISSTDFYTSTKNALHREHDVYDPHNLDEEAHRIAAQAERLKSAEVIAKENANSKAPPPKPIRGASKQTVLADDAVTGSGDRNVAGRKKYPIGGGDSQQAPLDTAESALEHDTTVEVNSILKMAPIIIFSKSYCPHSKRAKDILLDKYDIVPKPYVVELDEHVMGGQLQDKLASMTGRRTVPNVLVNGKSIGGGDDVAGLDEAGGICAKLQSMAGKRVQKCEVRRGH